MQIVVIGLCFFYPASFLFVFIFFLKILYLPGSILVSVHIADQGLANPLWGQIFDIVALWVTERH